MNRKDRRAGRAQKPGSANTFAPQRPATDRLFGLALAHQDAGRFGEAEQIFRQILAVDPRHADSLNGLGILAHLHGRSNAAIALIGQAIAVNDRVAQYHYNIGVVYAALGQMNETIAHNRRAITLEPDHADAHTNLANALLLKGQLADAITHFRRALSRRANSPIAYNNLATALEAHGDPEEALGVVIRGLAVDETDDLKRAFVRLLRQVGASAKFSGLSMLVLRVLGDRWGRPSDLAAALGNVIKQDKGIASCIERTSGGAPSARNGLGSGDLATLAENRLLTSLMVLTPLHDIALEQLLTAARRALLYLAKETADIASKKIRASDDVLKFACTLARQCFLNDYVYFCRPEERETAAALRDRAATVLQAGEAVAPLTLAAVAAYFPLYTLAAPPQAFERPWPEAARRVVVQQVLEPAEQARLQPSIPMLTPIEDLVSVAVRGQYEENPYPNWAEVSSLFETFTLDERLKILFPTTPFPPLGKGTVEILVAGCGTGRHAIETALQTKGAKVLAIDLSRASLGYALRKARELKVPNIEFAQADIVRLAAFDRTFDVIESVGVLHHLRDPWEGFRTLLALLRPGGFMRLGFYSELARRDVVAAREFIAARGYHPTPDDIRQCRAEMMESADGTALKRIAALVDFFTVSSCRDLLFHVQEHRTSTPEIKSFLAANNLAFLGFDTPARGAYGRLYPEDTAMTDLDRWHAFEQKHPATFAGMYQFWVQKPVG